MDYRIAIPTISRSKTIKEKTIGYLLRTDIDLSKIKTSIGVGVRYLVLPKERINVRIDLGFGTQHPGLYFNIREAF